MRTWLTSCFVLVLGCLVIACSGGGGVDPTDAAPDGAAADAPIDAFEIPDPNACGTGTTIVPLPVGGMASGSAASITPGNVSSTTCQGRGAETVYLVTVDHAVTLAATTDLPGTTLDTVLYVRTDCQEPSSELGCNDDLAVGNIHSSILVDLAAGSYYLIVDGRNVGAAGNYELAVNLYEGVGQPCTGPGTCAPGYTCRAIPPSTQTTCERHACDDGRDDDGDGEIDYPNDPGCTAAADDSETDPCPGVGCPVCADGVDNDGDGVMDYPTDPGCVAASWGSEENCIPELDPVTPIVAGTTTGSTIGAGNHFEPSCSTLDPAPDRVHVLQITAPLTTLTIDTNSTTFDTIVSVKDSLCAATLACDDDNGEGQASLLAMTNVAPGTYSIIVDGFDNSNGPYTLHVAGTYVAGAACDPAAPYFRCPIGMGCAGPTGNTTCVVTQCNDTVDADGDGRPGFPSDPGCTSISDPSEVDDCPNGPMCPACGNADDDDLDGRIDFPMDPGCAAASTPSEDCGGVDPVRPFTANVTNQSMVGLTNDVDLSCGLDGRDEAWRLVLPLPLAQLTVDTVGSPLDTVVGVKPGGCAIADLACDDNTAGNGDSRVVLTNVAAGDYFVIVDDRTAVGANSYNLNVSGRYGNGAACDPASTLFSCSVGFACAGPTPTCRPAACNDAVDADGDGFVGYPTDPGCASISDNDEADTCPTGPGCPVCGNDVDDDGDGAIDYPLDFGCTAASGASEVNCLAEDDPITAITTPASVGTTTGGTNDFTPTCGSQVNHTAPDRVHRLALQVPLATLHIDTELTGFDTTLTLSDANCGGTIVCDDQGGSTGGSSAINRTGVPAGTYTIIVDAVQGTSGPYNLNVRGTIAIGSACTDPLVASGVLTCVAGSTCAGPVGAETCVPTACNDTVDADGDGLPGFPTDPGCVDPSDNDESDTCPTGPTCPVCSNDLDDDADTVIDYPLDPGCASAAGTTELGCPGELDAITVINGPVSTGTTIGASNDFNPVCQPNDLGDRVHVLTLQVPVATLTMDTEGSALADPILMFSNAVCAQPPIACDDDAGSGNQAMITRANVAAGAYTIIVDTFGTNAIGGYQLNVRGVLAPGGSCADPLVAAGALSCPTGQTCQAGVCAP